MRKRAGAGEAGGPAPGGGWGGVFGPVAAGFGGGRRAGFLFWVGGGADKSGR